MDERTRRVGKNEAVFREVNEQIESLNRGMAAVSDGNMHIVCECADLLCAEQLVVPVGDYERIRSDATLFFIHEGHVVPDLEQVVEETPRYQVVRKNEGEPARIARSADPRNN
jgi:hypothetical protein